MAETREHDVLADQLHKLIGLLYRRYRGRRYYPLDHPAWQTAAGETLEYLASVIRHVETAVKEESLEQYRNERIEYWRKGVTLRKPRPK